MDRRTQILFSVAIIASVFAIYVYPLALPTPLLDPDEGLHATIAQQMVESGDYLVPRNGDTPFRDKPILYFAAQAASLRMFGMNEAAVRLPGILFALLGCFTTALLAKRLFDTETGVYAALASLTLVLPVVLTQSPAHDIALVPWLNLLVLCFWEQDQTEDATKRFIWLLGGAICVALALLTKGLIGIAVITSGLAAYILLTRTLSWSLCGRCAIVLLVGCALASPWFAYMELVSPGYAYYYFIQRHFLGFVTEAQEHGDVSWYYYFGPVIGGAMPWLPFAAAAVWQLRYDTPRQNASRATLLVACWFVGGFLFLNVAGSKLLTYSLPLFPPIAVLAGLGFRRFFHHNLAPLVERTFIRAFKLFSLFGVIGPVSTLLFIHYFWNFASPAAAYAVATLASALMAVSYLLFTRGRSRSSFAIGVLWTPVCFIFLMTWPVQQFAEQHSQRSLAQEISGAAGPPQQVLLVGERVSSFMFYLSSAERSWFESGRVREVKIKELAGLFPPSPGTVIAITDKKMRSYDRAQDFLRLKPRRAGKFNVVGTPTEQVMVAERPEPRGK